MLHLSSAQDTYVLKIGTERFSETSKNFCQCVRHHMLLEGNLHNHFKYSKFKIHYHQCFLIVVWHLLLLVAASRFDPRSHTRYCVLHMQRALRRCHTQSCIQVRTFRMQKTTRPQDALTTALGTNIRQFRPYFRLSVWKIAL